MQQKTLPYEDEEDRLISSMVSPALNVALIRTSVVVPGAAFCDWFYFEADVFKLYSAENSFSKLFKSGTIFLTLFQ